ncbi:hypothetical protein A9Z65_06795 [Moraxella nonliquefaciens]|nr:hypothetical protein A9Z65_06795 [Moraxella nonliquefaciens]
MVFDVLTKMILKNAYGNKFLTLWGFYFKFLHITHKEHKKKKPNQCPTFCVWLAFGKALRL